MHCKMCHDLLNAMKGKTSVARRVAQSRRERKKGANMEIIELIPVGAQNAVSRKTLCYITGQNDRTVRKMIAAARREHCICNSQDGAGYYIPETVQEAKEYLLQETHRLKSIGWSLKGARDFIRRGGAVDG